MPTYDDAQRHMMQQARDQQNAYYNQMLSQQAQQNAANSPLQNFFQNYLTNGNYWALLHIAWQQRLPAQPVTGTQIRIEEDLAKLPTAAEAFDAMDKSIALHEALVRELKGVADEAEAVNKATVAAHGWKPASQETPFEKECRRADELKRKITEERATQYMIDQINSQIVTQKDPEPDHPLGRAMSIDPHPPLRTRVMMGDGPRPALKT